MYDALFSKDLHYLKVRSRHVRNFNVVQSYHDNIHTLLVSDRNHLLYCVVLGAVYKFKVPLLYSGKCDTSVYSSFKDRMPQWLCRKIRDILTTKFSLTSWKVLRQPEIGMSAKEVFSLNFLNNCPIVLRVTGLLSVWCKINASATDLCERLWLQNERRFAVGFANITLFIFADKMKQRKNIKI